MTICRKCGKEVPDGEELCDECKAKESNSGESYLDELMLSIDTEEAQNPLANKIMRNKSGENESEESASEESESEGTASEDSESEEVPVLALEEPEEEPALEEESEPVLAEEGEEEEDLETEEDINQLLELLSKDYEEEGFEDMPETEPEEESEEEPEVFSSTASERAEASLFSEDESGDIFADSSESVAVDDVFQEALSAVDYSEKEKEDEQDEDLMALDPFVIEEEMPDEEEAAEEITISDLDEEIPEKPKEKPKNKESFGKRIFGNIITDQTAKEEARERELEQASEAERAKAKEEKKQQAAAARQEKQEQAKSRKEQKAALKAEQTAAKQAEKEEKKRLKMEREANEVVGRINPVGVTVVMVFFGLICIAVILGTRSLSYSSAVKNAESDFKERDYKSAYESIAGVEVSEKSAEMADKIRICMQLQRGLDGYQNYYKMKMYLESLDSLMKGIRSYDTNKGKADNYGILSQFDALKNQLASNLYSEFGVSEAKAREINRTESQVEYTAKLEEIIRLWEARNREDEK